MKNKHNHVLLFLLLLGMALGLLQSFGRSAWAETATASGLDALKEALENGGDIQLTDNIDIESSLVIKKNTSLDLNGYGIRFTEKKDSNTHCIEILSGITLTLIDSNPTETHYISLSGWKFSDVADSAPESEYLRIDDNGSGFVEVKGGYITSKIDEGSGVYNYGGTFNMRAGTIIGNYNKEELQSGGGGGGVRNGGTFNMSGGTIIANQAENGGGVYIANGATFTMTGGTISNNNADPQGGGGEHGGGVHVNGGTFTMSGGTISGNKADQQGGGVYISGLNNQNATFTMTGGTISGNTAEGLGGGVYVWFSNFTMTGGTISGNNGKDDDDDGGGVYFDSYTFSISGSPIITGNFKNETTSKDSNVYVKRGETLTVADTLTANAKLGITMEAPGVFTSGLSGKGSLSNFTSDVDGYLVRLNNNEAALVQHTHEFSYALSGDSTLIATCGGNDNCNLTDKKATLTICPPTTGDGKAILSSDAEEAFGSLVSLASSITYQSKTNGTWGTETSTPPTAEGIHRAKLTLTLGGQSYTISVSYGMNCINYTNTEGSHGKVLGPGGATTTGATVGAIVEPEFTPDTGYEVDTLTVTPDDSSVGTVTVNGNTSFIMPESTVTVSATFKLSDYGITIPSTTGGTVTAPKSTANYQDSITLTITPDTGYELDTLSVKDSSNNEVSVSNNTFTMPASAVTVSAAFKKIDYTITIGSLTNGTITAQSTANYQDSVPLTITPATGYELATLSVKDSNNNAVEASNNTFTMPASNVTVSATFTKTNYNISSVVTNGSVIVPETAQYQDTVRLVVSPDAGLGVQSITANDGVTLTLVSRDTATGVEVYDVEMPAQELTVNVVFQEITIYTIFYAASTASSVSYRFYDTDTEGRNMSSGAQVGTIACWAGQVQAAKGRTSFPVAVKVDSGSWGTLADREVKAPSNIGSMSDGDIVLVEGDENAFIAAFIWGSGNMAKYYFVTASTVSVTVPNPSADGYNFTGWSYSDENLASHTISSGSGSTTVAISGNITKTTSFGAIWQRKNPTVTYDLNGGSWSASNSANVTYGGTLTQPTNPTRTGYAFERWTLNAQARVMKGTQEVVLSEGSTFDFASTKIIENLTLKATWKHVHAYVYLQLSAVNSSLPGTLTQAQIDAYGPYMHFKLCTHVDDSALEAHAYGKEGKCVCGAVMPNPDVTLELTNNDRNASKVSKAKVKQNTAVTLTAKSSAADKFVKWEGRYLNGSTWYDLSSSPIAGFVLTDSIRINAVYDTLSSPKLTLKAEHYGTDGLLFTMQYSLPTGWKATNAVIVYGDNHMLRYMAESRYEGSDFNIAGQIIGWDLPGGDVGKVTTTIRYYDREDNILANAATSNKDMLRRKMLGGYAVNIPGYNEAMSKKAQNLGQLSGYAYGGLSGVKNDNNGNHYFYVLGLVEYTEAKSSTSKMAVVGPIAVTYNSTSTAVTDTTIKIY